MAAPKIRLKKDLILAIDQGTTGTGVLLVDKNLKIVGSNNTDFKQYFPLPGWVEHDLDDIWKSVLQSIRGVFKSSKVSPSRVAAIGITNQRETSCFWSRKSGKALGRAIVWQDRRTSDQCTLLRSQGHEPMINQKTGLLLDPYFSATKVSWALQNSSVVKKAAKSNDLCFGTVDSFLIYRLTQRKVHATEPSNASRTMFMDLARTKWDDDLLKLFDVPKNILPEIRDSVGDFGVTSGIPGLPDGIPIRGVLGDQQAALLGQACITSGTAKCTFGTGAFILLNTGKQIKRSSHRQLSTVAWKIKGETYYALEGSAFTAGACVQWLRDELGIIESAEQIEEFAKKVDSTEGVVFVPALAGLGAPYWRPDSRAAFFGMTRGTNRYHLCRAVLEGIALLNHDILNAMCKDLGQKLQTLKVDGGASQNNFLMQFQADVLNTTLMRPKVIESTALGAVFAAGLGIGIWDTLEKIELSWKKDKLFKSRMKQEDRLKIVRQWDSAVSSVDWSQA